MVLERSVSYSEVWVGELIYIEFFDVGHLGLG